MWSWIWTGVGVEVGFGVGVEFEFKGGVDGTFSSFAFKLNPLGSEFCLKKDAPSGGLGEFKLKFFGNDGI